VLRPSSVFIALSVSIVVEISASAVITLASLVWKYKDSDLMGSSASLMIASSPRSGFFVAELAIERAKCKEILCTSLVREHSYSSLSYRYENDQPMPGNFAKWHTRF